MLFAVVITAAQTNLPWLLAHHRLHCSPTPPHVHSIWPLTALCLRRLSFVYGTKEIAETIKSYKPDELDPNIPNDEVDDEEVNRDDEDPGDEQSGDEDEGGEEENEVGEKENE
ncbi:hypothetical protein FRC12_022804 [Ceratobasidium sp. 428]|nr:hypothetical protein FRC12_022804 [Ceratobasidium sp. 428]